MGGVCPNAVPEGRIIRILVLRFGMVLGRPIPGGILGGCSSIDRVELKESINQQCPLKNVGLSVFLVFFFGNLRALVDWVFKS